MAQQHNMTANKANMILNCIKREGGSPGVPYTLLNPHSTRDINKPNAKRKRAVLKATSKILSGSL